MKQVLMSPEQSCMKLRPSVHQKDPKAHSFFSVVITKKNGEKYLVSDFAHNVFPAGAIDHIHAMSFINTTNNGLRGFGAIALTADTTQTVNAAQTSLVGEITTNGLARVEATTKTHTNGTNSSLIEHTFTLTGSQADITRAALFNITTAPVSGIMGPFAAFSNGATGAMTTGETVKVSITINTT